MRQNVVLCGNGLINVARLHILTFPTKQNWDQANLKAFADNKLNVTKMIISVCDRVENIVGKRRNCLYRQFLLFPQCFQKASFLDLSKGVIVREWVNFHDWAKVYKLTSLKLCQGVKGKQVLNHYK